MKGGKPISSPLGNHFKLIKKSCPNSNDEKKKMKSIIPYSFVVGSLMYAMLCTRTDIAHTIRVVSRFLSNLEKEHWEVVKWIFRYLTSSSSVSCVMEEFNTLTRAESIVAAKEMELLLWLKGFLQELDKAIQLKKIDTEKNASDMLTKVVPKKKLKLCQHGVYKLPVMELQVAIPPSCARGEHCWASSYMGSNP
ncbi:hypothetical protein AAG906_039021 [Vitis piasezkii]